MPTNIIYFDNYYLWFKENNIDLVLHIYNSAFVDKISLFHDLIFNYLLVFLHQIQFSFTPFNLSM